MFSLITNAGKIFTAIIVILSIGLSVYAAEQANRSFYEERGKLLGWPSTISYAVAGLILLGIEYLTKSWFVLFILLQIAMIALQLLNKEGIKRRNSWSAYSWEIFFLGILAYAGYCDKHQVLFPNIGTIVLMAVILILALIAGNVKVLYLDNPDYYQAWFRKINESKIASAIFIAIAIGSALLMFLALGRLLS
ncbi:hypothetical protein IKW75_02255 [Candidatus Saccharibacteria bacterium]|nr:hypothetical protein [Candidatus Saccharibacteria bacterium]